MFIKKLLKYLKDKVFRQHVNQAIHHIFLQKTYVYHPPKPYRIDKDDSL